MDQPLMPPDAPMSLGRPGDRREPGADVFDRAARTWGKSLAVAAANPTCFEVFDATKSHVGRRFAAIVGARSRKEGSGQGADGLVMNLHHFRQALRAEGFAVREGDPAADELLVQVFRMLESQASQGGGITEDVFHDGLQRLILHVLKLPEHELKCGPLQLMDWSPAEVYDAYFYPLRTELPPQEPRFNMRWIHLAAPTRADVWRMAVEYSLHPLAVEEVLQDSSTYNVARSRKLGSNHFCLLPVCQVSPATLQMLDQFEEDRRANCSDVEADEDQPPPSVRVAVEVRHTRLCLFLLREPQWHTVISMTHDWEDQQPDHFSPSKEKRVGRTRGVVAEDRKNLAAASSKVDACADGHVLDPVARALQVDFSKLRMGNGSWFTWKVMSVVVSSFVTIEKAYSARLDWFQAHHDFPEVAVELMRMKSDLERLLRKIEPLEAVVEHLQNEKTFDVEVEEYLSDVADDLKRAAASVQRRIGACSALQDEINSERDAAQNDLSFKLTILASLLIPLQFLTGVYGMNFVTEDKAPTVPLLGVLTEERSYILFWGLGLFITLVCVVWFFYIQHKK